MAITVFDNRFRQPNKQPIAILTWTFTTDASGDASEESVTILGKIKRVVTNPDNTDPPTANWDLTITDEDGIDILCGNGADRDAGGTGISEQAFPCPAEIAVASKLTFTVANGGNTKKGVVKLYIT